MNYFYDIENCNYLKVNTSCGSERDKLFTVQIVKLNTIHPITTSKESNLKVYPLIK